MPSTYNGIGTHYYGRSNRETRTAPCHSCGRVVQLESYNTRLWFVIVFIPVIPLGRKRIIDQCPFCTRHFVADADKWETQKQLNVSGALEKYHSDPTPEHAMEAHQQLLNFHQTTQAAEFRREIAGKFSQSARVQAYLGQAMAQQGQWSDAGPFFQRALELRPDLPEARIGVARDRIRTGHLDEARALLDFLEKPGAGQLYSLEPIETLANAYQRQGKFKEALELFRCLLTALPHIGQIKDFRKRVQACEKSLGLKQSILPKWKFSWKSLFSGGASRPRQPGSIRLTWRGMAIAAAVVILFIVLISFHDVYQRRHRPLFIVNGFKDRATVEIRGVKTVPIAGHSQQKLELPEGMYHVSINGPVHQETDINIKIAGSPNSPVWLLNIGGAALLLEEHVTYTAAPPPPEISVHYGQTFERIDNVTHPFETLPQSLQMNSNEALRVLTSLNFPNIPADQLLSWFQLRGRKNDELRVAEWRIKSKPDDVDALEIFLDLADPKHAEEVLRDGLSRRPVELEWHRAYQNVQGGADWYQRLQVVYDGFLKTEPANSALLYLRGRVELAPGEPAKWFLKARDADPRNSFAYYALGYDHASIGDWEEARKLYFQAVTLNPDETGFSNAFFESRLALQDYPALEKDLRAALARQPLEFGLKLQLLQVLMAQDRRTEAEKIVKDMRQKAQLGKDTGNILAADMMAWQFEYLTGDFAAMAQSAARDRSAFGRNALFIAQIEQGKVAEAAHTLLLDQPKPGEAHFALAVSLAWALAHDNPQADAWLKRAVDLLRKGAPDQIRAADLFSPDAAPTLETLRTIELDLKTKPIILAILGLRHPERRQELFAEARRLNVDRSFPYQLLRRVTSETP